MRMKAQKKINNRGEKSALGCPGQVFFLRDLFGNSKYLFTNENQSHIMDEYTDNNYHSLRGAIYGINGH